MCILFFVYESLHEAGISEPALEILYFLEAARHSQL